MKKILTTAFVSISILRAQASILTVSNAAYLPAQYGTVQAAIDAAMINDTILISTTAISYGSAAVDKSLSFFGSGGNLGVAPNCAFTLLNANTSGCRFEGLQCSISTAVGNVNTDINNVIVRRCKVGGIWIETTTANESERNEAYNWLVEGCVFTGENLAIASPFGYSTFVNWTVRNCIFNGQLYDLDYSLVENCLFLGNALYEYAFADVNYTSIRNNIFFGQTCLGFQYSTIYNNINVSAEGGCTVGDTNDCYTNLYSTDPQLTNAPQLGFYSEDYDYHLQPGSAAIAFAEDNGDCGVYDESGIFRKDIEPSIPIVRQITIPGGTTVPAEGSFQITIHSVSHQ
jgi:hypothetical protein